DLDERRVAPRVARLARSALAVPPALGAAVAREGREQHARLHRVVRGAAVVRPRPAVGVIGLAARAERARELELEFDRDAGVGDVGLEHREQRAALDAAQRELELLDAAAERAGP